MHSAPMTNRSRFPRSASSMRAAPSQFHTRASTPFEPRSLRTTERLIFSDYHEDLKQSSNELRLLIQELDTLNDQKDVLQDIVDQLKREMHLGSTYTNKIRKNQDKLHTESDKISKANDRINEDRSRTNREIALLYREVRDLDKEVKDGYDGCMDIKLQIEAENAAISGLTSVTKKMKKELSLQMKERDVLKSKSAETEKQIFQISNRIEKLRLNNYGFLEKINRISRNVS